MLESDLALNQINKIRQDKNRKVRAAKKREKMSKGILFGALIVMVWVGIVYGGFYYSAMHLEKMEERFTHQIERLLSENKQVEAMIAGSMQAFQEELKLTNQEITHIQSELNLIQEELALTGETITGTDQTRQSLQDRMTELDNQLASLRIQLIKLEDAVRAF